MKDIDDLIADEIEHPTADDVDFLKQLPQYFCEAGKRLQIVKDEAEVLAGNVFYQIFLPF